MSLAIIILLIILVPAIPFFCLLKKRKWKFWLDESSLHVQPLFWFLVFLPLIISGIAWVLVAQDYELDVSTNGYSRLMENAKFPFLILALSPILGAFVTSAHRSLQTEIQIKTANNQLMEAQKKNKVDMYYSARKHINEQLQSIKDRFNEPIKRPTTLYMSAYEIQDNYVDSVRKDFYSYIDDGIYDLTKNLGKIKKYSKNTILMKDDFDAIEFAHFSILLANINTSIAAIKYILTINSQSEENSLIIIHNNRLEELEKSEKETRVIQENIICNFLKIDIENYIIDILDIIKEVFLILSPTKSIDDVLLNYRSIEYELESVMSYLQELCLIQE